jgi:MvaI/BcnI restriction endonuclease family
MQKSFTKEELINELTKIAISGWIPSARDGNAGGVGNTLEDLLGIQENNLPIPNAAEWELKCQRLGTSSLMTLLHCEPSPTALRFVPQILLPLYGWAHKEAGARHPASERSFRQTIHAMNPSDRGFMVQVDRMERKILISFDASVVSDKHATWLQSVESSVGLSQLEPQPYWGFDDLCHKVGSKLHNCFYVQAEVKKVEGKEFFRYSRITMLKRFNFEGLLRGLETGMVLVDFDARTGHNHGTKFRMRQNYLPYIYEEITPIIDLTDTQKKEEQVL